VQGNRIELRLARSRGIQESCQLFIQTPDLFLDNSDGLQAFPVAFLAKFSSQQLDVNSHRVKRISDLVRQTRREGCQRAQSECFTSFAFSTPFLGYVQQKDKDPREAASTVRKRSDFQPQGVWLPIENNEDILSIHRISTSEAAAQMFDYLFVPEKREHLLVQALSRFKSEKHASSAIGKQQALLVIEDENSFRHRIEDHGKQISFLGYTE
jgi:hypothetical protein